MLVLEVLWQHLLLMLLKHVGGWHVAGRGVQGMCAGQLRRERTAKARGHAAARIQNLHIRSCRQSCQIQQL